MKLEGFGIFVKDMPAMVRFYRDVLGFAIKEDENASNVFLEKDGTLFLLYRRSDFEQMTAQQFTYASGRSGIMRSRSMPEIMPVSMRNMHGSWRPVQNRSCPRRRCRGDSAHAMSQTPRAISLRLVPLLNK